MGKTGTVISWILYLAVCATMGYLIADAFFDSFVVGLIVLVLAVVIIPKFKKVLITNDDSTHTRKGVSDKSVFVVPPIVDRDIDRNYFQQISKVVDDLMTVYDSAISSPEFRDAASDGFDLHNGDETIEDPTGKIQYLF